MVFRRRRPPAAADPTSGIDAGALPAAYRAPVEDAVRARRQFGALVAGTAPGPLRERLDELASRVDAGVLAVWGTARHAAELERVLAALDPDRVSAELKQAKRDGADAAVVETLAARFASVQRLLNALDDVRQRLPVLEARLGTVVARTAELTLTSSLATAPADLAGLERELDGVTADLHALTAASRALA